MSLKAKIVADLTTAMKAKDELRVSTLRMIKADVMKFEVSGASKVEATDENVMDCIKRGVKQRKDSVEAFEKAGSMDLANREKAEITILMEYMPAQMSEEQLRPIIQETIAQMKATPADFGKVMGTVVGKTKGQADGTVISKLVKELLK